MRYISIPQPLLSICIPPSLSLSLSLSLSESVFLRSPIPISQSHCLSVSPSDSISLQSPTLISVPLPIPLPLCFTLWLRLPPIPHPYLSPSPNLTASLFHPLTPSPSNPPPLSQSLSQPHCLSPHLILQTRIFCCLHVDHLIHFFFFLKHQVQLWCKYLSFVLHYFLYFSMDFCSIHGTSLVAALRRLTQLTHVRYWSSWLA